MTLPSSPIICRAAASDNVASALRLVLSSGPIKASDAQVVDFLRYALHRGIDTSATFLAERNGEILTAILPVPSAGRTMLLLASSYLPTPDQSAAFGTLLEYVLHAYTSAGIHLTQVLLDPSEAEAIDLYCKHAFRPLAELLYLQAPTRRANRAPVLPPDHAFITYSPSEHGRFARTIAATYNGSLDCPGLAGKRDIEDIIAGHRATGDFDPNLWFLLVEQDQPVGVVLLASAPPTDSMELVYLGLTAAARHRGLADVLMRQALFASHAQSLPKLTLAVDSNNTPALKLYYRHGMRRLYSKVALMRDLRENQEKIQSLDRNERASSAPSSA